MDVKSFLKLIQEKGRSITMIAIMIVVIFLLEGSGYIGFITSPVQNTFVPIQLAIYKTRADFKNFLTTVVEIRTLRESENRLRDENAQILAENAKLRKLEEENKVLREQLAAKKISRKLIVAAVIGEGPLFSSSEILVDKGTSDGVVEGELVVIKDILIGEVISVGSASSTVRLLSDTQTKIPAVTEKGVKGILKGEFGSSIVFDRVVQGEKLKVGEIIFSSGEADYPKGLVLGKIEKVESKPAALFQKADVASLVSFDSLDTVFIIRTKQ